MKLVFKKSSMEFRPSYPSGTEIPVTPVYSGTYAIGNGYYLSNGGGIVHLAAYEGKSTAISNLIPVYGYSKIKVSNLVNNIAQAVLAFFADSEQTLGTNPESYSGSSGGSIEVNIPANALYIRVGHNTDGSGDMPLGNFQLKLVV